VLLTCVPNFGELYRDEKDLTEIIFLIDRSSSMQDRIQAARTALTELLTLLPDEVFFNIFSFGSHHSHLFDQPRRKRDDGGVAQAALAYIAGMEADMGTTELLEPLRAIYEAPLLAERTSRRILLITDGAIESVDDVFELARRHVSHTQIFTFGIGHGVSKELVSGLVRAGKGTAEYLQDGASLAACLKQQLARALQTSAAQVNLDWGVRYIAFL